MSTNHRTFRPTATTSRRPASVLGRGLTATALISMTVALAAACSDSGSPSSGLAPSLPDPEGDSSLSMSPDSPGEDPSPAMPGDANPSAQGNDEPGEGEPSAANEDPTAGIDGPVADEGDDPAASDGEGDEGEADEGESDEGEDEAGEDPVVGEGDPEPEPEPPAAFAPCPTDGSACAIMPLGDSITDGVGSSGGGYRIELFRQLLAGGKNATFVGTLLNGPNNVGGQPFPRAHEGHSGFTISGGAAGSLATEWDEAIDVTDPHIVLLMIGTNDINGNINVGNAPARLGALLDRITGDAPDALVVVAQIVPTTNQGTNQRVTAYNDAMVGVVQARIDDGRHLQLLDMFTPFASTPNFDNALMNDFLHPNDAGYVVMGRTWFQAIDSLLPE